MKLNFGFEDIPYSGSYRRKKLLSKIAKKIRAEIQGSYGQGKTTGRVAEELETNYGIVEDFYNKEEDDIVELLEEKFGEDIDDIMMMRAPSRKGLSDRYTRQIEEKFRSGLRRERYFSRGKVPTASAQRGVSHLLPQPYARGNAPRPSFINTGLYMNSFRVWVTDVED